MESGRFIISTTLHCNYFTLSRTYTRSIREKIMRAIAQNDPTRFDETGEFNTSSIIDAVVIDSDNIDPMNNHFVRMNVC